MRKMLSALILGWASLLLLLLATQPGTALAPLPAIADQFASPFGPVPSTTDYAVQWNVIVADTRYGIRNLSLLTETRRCWGMAWNRLLHSAIDLYRADGLDAAGTPVYAVADGQVAYYNPNYTGYPGRVVLLSHRLEDGRTLYSMYAHLGTVTVAQGQAVSRNQPIGTILYQPGDSHLHFELRWFLDGSQIYPSWTACNGTIYGRGYTYLTYPDDFPAPGYGYVDPDAFIQSHGGPPLTPIGFPDPRTPITLTTTSVEWASSAKAVGAPAARSVVWTPAAFDLGGPVIVITPTPKIAPEPTPKIAPAVIAAPLDVPSDTLTMTLYLPLLANDSAWTEPPPDPEPDPDSACVEGRNLLRNGDFEGGPGSEPWVQVRNSTSELISTSRAFSGTYSAWLGGWNMADEEVLQAVWIPTDTVGMTLTFKRLLTSQEYEAKVYDHFELVLENQVGNEVSPQLSFTNLTPQRNVWVTETAAFAGLEAWTNRWLRLSAKGMTDGTLPSSLYLDAITLQTRCAP